MLTLALERIQLDCVAFKGTFMVYLKPLYSRLNRLALHKSSQFSMEAQQEHVKILFQKM